MNMSNHLCNDWLLNVKRMRFNNLSYYIYQTPVSNGEFMLSNFNFNISEYSLRTDDEEVAIRRSELILNNQIKSIEKGLSKISKFTNRFKRQSIKYVPQLNELVLNVNKYIEKIDNL